MPRFIGYPRSAITRHYRFSVLEISCSICAGFRLGFFLFLSKAQFRVRLVRRAPNVAVKPYRSTFMYVFLEFIRIYPGQSTVTSIAAGILLA